MAKDLPSRTNREKAQRPKPYDRTTASGILKKVKDTVCDYLPSWLNLQSWTSSGVSASSSRSSSVNVQQVDSDNDEEEVDFHESGLYEPGPSQIVSTQAVAPRLGTPDISCYTRCPLTRTATETQPLVNGDDQSDNSESSASTSGCSSLAPSHQEKKRLLRGLPVTEEALLQIKKDLSNSRAFLGKRKKDASVFVDLPDAPGGNETPSSRMSLWSEDEGLLLPKRPTRPQPIGTGNRPSFRPTYFGAPVPIDGQSSFLGMSPFYHGRTSFGGASALNVSRCSTSKVPTPRVTVRRQVSSECIGSAAKKILNTLESMTTPISDAKKIPTEKNSVDIALSFTPRSYRRMTMQNASRKNEVKRLGPPPVQSVGTPYPTSRIPKHPAYVSEQNKEIATSKSGSLESRDSLDSRKTGGKMMRTSKRTHYSAKADDDEVVEVPVLPSVPLPITSLPRFNFALTSTPAATTTATEDGPQFSFASPIRHDAPMTSTSSPSSSTFTFSAPEIVTDKNFSQKEDSNFIPPPPEMNFASGMTPAAKAVPLPLEPVNHDEESKTFVGGLQPAKELIVGRSVMDILGRKTSTEDVTDDIEKKAEEIEVVTTSCSSGFGNRFAPPAGNWTCDTCLINNSPELSSCQACQMPNSKTATTPTSKPPDATDLGFGKKFAPPTGSWECDACMVRNKREDSRCVACETPRTTAEKTSGVKEVFTGFKFGNHSKNVMPATASFKFGTSEIGNNNNKDFTAPPAPKFGFATHFASETSQTTAFKFGLAEEKTNNVSKPVDSGGTGFKFGVPTTDSATTKTPEEKPPVVLESSTVPKSDSTTIVTTTSFTFGNYSKLPETSGPIFGMSSKASETTFGSVAKEPSSVFGSGELKPSIVGSGFKFGSSDVASDATFQFGTNTKLPKQETSVTKPSSETSDIPKTSGSNVFGQNSGFVEAKSSGVSFRLPTDGASLPFGGFSATSTTTTTSSDVTTTKTSAPGFNFFASGVGSGSDAKTESKASVTPSPFAFGTPKLDSSVKGFAFGDKSTIVSTVSTCSQGSTFVFTPSAFTAGSNNKLTKISEASDAKVASVAPSFTFGAAAAAQPSSQKFEFLPPKNESAPSVGGFKFSLGTTPATSVTAATSGSNPTFGGFRMPTASPSGRFTFGAPATTATVFSTGQTTGPLFGGQSAFGSFGSAAPPVFGQSQDVPLETPGFQFNTSAPVSDGSLFRFGAQQEPASSGSFTFGNAPSAPQPAPANTGFTFSATTPLSFNFGASQTQPSAPFQFTPSSDNIFNPGSSVTFANRKIRRATRRTTKK